MKSLRSALTALSAGIFGATSVWFPTLSWSANQGAGDLVDAPLFASFSVESNVFFMLDDSGSMHWDITSRLGSLGATNEGKFRVTAQSRNSGESFRFIEYEYTTAALAENDNITIAPTWEGIQALAASTINDRIKTTFAGIWRARNHDFNRTYYDPTRVYRPWSGVNNQGQAYTQANPAQALSDPYNPNSVKYNLTTDKNNTTFYLPEERGQDCNNNRCSMQLNYFPATYWTWVDTNGDGRVDPGERGTRYEIRSSGSYPKAASRTDCAGNTCTYNEEIQNFANWWQYHSRREFSMKAAVSEVIANANGVRMGMSTINENGGDAVRKQIKSMNSDPASGDKKALLDGLFSIHSQSGTPLRRALRDAGDYFTCNSSGVAGSEIFGSGTPCPMQTAGTNPAGECQQNFTILFTDGFYNGSSVDTTNHDGNNSSPFDRAPYSDSVSETLADIAMLYYETDLATSLANRVPTRCGVDENSAQHMVTYTIGFGVSGTISAADLPPHPQLGLATECTAQTPSPFTWPTPNGSNPASLIDDLVHAAYNGRGEFYSAQSSQELVDSINQTIQSISDRVGSGAAVSFNASVLDTDTAVYVAEFDTSRWSGDLTSIRINSNGTLGSENWSAANVLDSLGNNNLGGRRIYTRNDATANGGGLLFENLGDLTVRQQADLNTAPNGSPDGLGQARLDYIRGDRSREDAAFRTRDSRLGDIIQSGAVFVGIPSLNWPDRAPFPGPHNNTTAYSEFRSSLSDVTRDPPDTGPVVSVRSRRTEMVYVGANDGMLHGFRASDGVEQFAYIPSYLFSTPLANGSHPANEGLHYLTNPAYNHRFHHDMTPTISDVFIDGSWKTVLIGAHRAGAPGLFALDITSPGSFSSANILWEFRGEVLEGSPLGDPDLGYTFSKPSIALTNEGRWAAIFGNGYNQSGGGNDGDQAQLFIVFLDNPGNSWNEGTDYIKISTGFNGGSADFNNGLSTPSLVDLDGNGTVDRAYAGDLAGNIWSFDLCARLTSTGNCQGKNAWKVAHDVNGVPAPLFDGVPQQHITTQPQVIRNPIVANTDANSPNLLVMFGTGRYISHNDDTNTDTQTFYGVWDAGTANVTATQLVTQTISTVDVNNNTFRFVTDNAVNYSETGAQGLGWRVNLPVVGERSVTDAIVRDGIVFFTTIVPSSSPCDAGGTGYIMFLAVENGGVPANIVFDLNNDGVYNQQDLIGPNRVAAGGSQLNVGLPSSPAFLGNRVYVTGTDTTVPVSNNVAALSTPLGRVSWEVIVSPLSE